MKAFIKDTKLLLQSIPSYIIVGYVLSVVFMNILANREWNVPISWIGLDCGFFLSWISFLNMDCVAKRFGAKASFELSITALFYNLCVCGILFVIMQFVTGTWSASYNYTDPEVQKAVGEALTSTFKGTWFVLLGSSIAFVCSSFVNSYSNQLIGKLIHDDANNTHFVKFAIRSYGSTMIGQFVDNLVFAFIVSYNFFGWSPIKCVGGAFTGAIFELLMEVVFSPIGFNIVRRWEKHNVGTEYLQAHAVTQ